MFATRFAKILAIAALALLATGCHHVRHREALGLAAGALVGGAIGDATCYGDLLCTTTGAIIGGAVGYAAGRHSGPSYHGGHRYQNPGYYGRGYGGRGYGGRGHYAPPPPPGYHYGGYGYRR